ncbi:DUF4124 domain-containing protein [Fulvimonas sp. R45]|uniref:DUF4124 domain-containing protein n=1 Tax=Fulvimonas sp. R45 TaxID=3045937 RepID=UPI00265FFCA7|nr:DUF4124 domain-containing protein [Fulvimonas sp. R45]MDO1527546.1 DUF4124 domain-containing protein [Fulvimonas sp. R45]
MTRHGILLLLLLAAAPGAAATTVYKCITPDGRVSYQGSACAAGQRQQVMQLADPAPVALPPPLPIAATQAPAPSAPPPVAAPPPAAPLPVLYRCVRATDGKTYLSGNGQPAPYLAPLGMLGVLPSSLADTYGAANHMGHGKVTAGLVASHYTWVQDSCRELGPRETCQALRDAWDENEDKLRRAFQSDQPPLLQREAELRAQLTNC